MTSTFADWDERTLDLAIDRFTVGLDRRDGATLDRSAASADLHEFENALTSIHLAYQGDVEAPPAEFLSRLEKEGRLHVAKYSTSSEPERATIAPFPSRALAYAGWLVAAALLMSVFLFEPTSSASPDARRAALIAETMDLVRLEWTGTEDPAATKVSGDVVWNTDLQEGYMRFRNLAPNVPEDSQYQLWIFDTTRADWEAKPVDGGVFDIPTDSRGSDVVIPIHAKLDVREPALFAVTIEVPGGVVVSEREHLILTAAL